jgi:hypothetical protein
MIELFGSFWFLLFASSTIVSVAGTLAHAWQKIRRAEAATALKQAMLERGLSVDEMERLLEAPLSDEQLVQQLAKRLAEESASGETITTVLEAFQAADRPRKRLLYHAIFGLSDGMNASDEQILAAVRGLSQPETADRSPQGGQS